MCLVAKRLYLFFVHFRARKFAGGGPLSGASAVDSGGDPADHPPVPFPPEFFRVERGGRGLCGEPRQEEAGALLRAFLPLRRIQQKFKERLFARSQLPSKFLASCMAFISFHYPRGSPCAQAICLPPFQGFFRTRNWISCITKIPVSIVFCSSAWLIRLTVPKLSILSLPFCFPATRILRLERAEPQHQPEPGGLLGPGNGLDGHLADGALLRSHVGACAVGRGRDLVLLLAPSGQEEPVPPQETRLHREGHRPNHGRLSRERGEL